ncbi:hypothetical protein E2C01_006837 [Portunus trituberculatus]|uniref:Uncharacterized protein n=1 Tax=Portunus trituberculatus TaxID=210409 RepID=A0A5B7CZ81_PORTR|nr:hypothetical protein [Portunus trituberculatus]
MTQPPPLAPFPGGCVTLLGGFVGSSSAAELVPELRPEDRKVKQLCKTPATPKAPPPPALTLHHHTILCLPETSHSCLQDMTVSLWKPETCDSLDLAAATEWGASGVQELPIPSIILTSATSTGL